MKNRLLRVLPVLFVLLIASPLALAQTSGQMEGVVTDEENLALPGVKVVATSPSLMGERAVNTIVDQQNDGETIGILRFARQQRQDHRHP